MWRTIVGALVVLVILMASVESLLGDEASIANRQWVLFDATYEERFEVNQKYRTSVVAADEQGYFVSMQLYSTTDGAKYLDYGLRIRHDPPPDIINQMDQDAMGKLFTMTIDIATSKTLIGVDSSRDVMPGSFRVYSDCVDMKFHPEIIVPDPLTEEHEPWDSHQVFELGVYALEIPEEPTECKIRFTYDMSDYAVYHYTNDPFRAEDILRMKHPERRMLIAGNEERYRAQDERESAHEYYAPGEGMRRIKGTADPAFFCHDFAWRPDGRRTARPSNEDVGFDGSHINPDKIMADPEGHGFKELASVSELRAGDIVVYLNSPDVRTRADHSAMVYRVKGRQVVMRSKDVRNSIFEHALGDGNAPNFFRDRYGASGLRLFRRLSPAAGE